MRSFKAPEFKIVQIESLLNLFGREVNDMSLVWVLLACALAFGALVLIVFLLSFDSAFAKWLGCFFWRGRLTLLVISVIFLLFTSQEAMTAKRESEQHHKPIEGTNLDFDPGFHVAEKYRSQRNLYMTTTGFVVYFGILLISYQVHTWTDRINSEKSRLRKVQ
jgi:hypothetical protein